MCCNAVQVHAAHLLPQQKKAISYRSGLRQTMGSRLEPPCYFTTATKRVQYPEIDVTLY